MAELGRLIPGVSDEVALLCLAKVPRRNRFLLRCVSKAWRKALGRPPGPRIIICVASTLKPMDRGNRADARWFVFDLVLRLCESIPSPWPPPFGPSDCALVQSNFFEQAKLWKLFAGCTGQQSLAIALFGPQTYCLEIEGSEELQRTRYVWRQGPLMKEEKRWRYAAAEEEGEGFIYVAGGGNLDGQLLSSVVFKSAESFDMKRRCWQSLPDLHASRYCAKGRMLSDGRFCISAGLPARDNFEYGEVYDPATKQWCVVKCPLLLHAGFHDTPRVPLQDHYFFVHFTGRVAQLKRVDHSNWYNSETVGNVPIPGYIADQARTHLSAVGRELFIFTGESLLITSPFVRPLRWTRLSLPFNSKDVYSYVVVGGARGSTRNIMHDDGYALRLSVEELEKFKD